MPVRPVSRMFVGDGNHKVTHKNKLLTHGTSTYIYTHTDAHMHTHTDRREQRSSSYMSSFMQIQKPPLSLARSPLQLTWSFSGRGSEASTLARHGTCVSASSSMPVHVNSSSATHTTTYPVASSLDASAAITSPAAELSFVFLFSVISLL